MINLLTIFRIIAFLEGVTYVFLLFIAMPIKYILHNPYYVKLLGMPHGLLFIAYIVMAIILQSDMKWTNKTLFIILVAAIIPFGTFYIDKTYLKSANGKY